MKNTDFFHSAMLCLYLDIIMRVYIIRHGQDDDSVRGGWSNTSLTELGIDQAKNLAEEISDNYEKYNIGKIYSSDLLRARQTADIISSSLNNVDVIFEKELREVNNGALAGMKNEVAEVLYPNLYWRNLGWEESYPDGESPKDFYIRVSDYFSSFIKNVADYDKNILVVTHGGVINIIKSIVNNEKYSNKHKYSGIQSCKMDFFIEV